METCVRSPLSDAVPSGLIRGLERRFILVVLSVALLLLLDEAVLQPSLIRLNGLAPVINLAGRQRMLSQQISKAALGVELLPAGPEPESCQRELREALFVWSRVHADLQTGDPGLQLQPATAPSILEAFRELEGQYQRLHEAATRIAAIPRPDRAALAQLLSTEPAYLRQMDRVVSLYEGEAVRQVARLRQLGLLGAGLVIALLAGLGRFVLHPAACLIREQVDLLATQRRELQSARDDLELRVAARTAELTAANQALAREFDERQRAEERNRTLQNQLGHASRVTSLGQLATGLAHELNQPLTAIANYAESALIASSTPGDQDVRHPLLERIRDSALRAGLIVRRMRNFVRPSPGSRANVSLPSLIDDVIQLCQPELRADGVQMEMHVDTEAGTVCVDAIQIQQVLVNLLQNALQAMRPLPRENRHLRLRASREAGEIQVDVEDSGPGFDPRQSGLIPEQFATTRSEGLGMGLAISRTIVTAHGGRLWAANRPEGGARVSFSLPVMGSHADLIDTSADCVRRR